VHARLRRRLDARGHAAPNRDRGERYADTLYDADWRSKHGLDAEARLATLLRAMGEGELRGEPEAQGYPRRRVR
jgi:hypothetical protein